MIPIRVVNHSIIFISLYKLTADVVYLDHTIKLGQKKKSKEKRKEKEKINIGGNKNRAMG